MSKYVSKSAFAKLYGCSKAYVSQLVAAGRIVLEVEGGHSVDVDATFELLGVTSDPSKVAVRERWAAYRAATAAAATSAPAAPAPAPVPTPVPAADGQQLTLEAEATKPAAEPRASAYHDARTLREQSQARLAQLELQRALGEVLDAEATLKAVLNAHTAVRSELMQLPDRLAQLVAPEIDPRKCYDLIRAECERLCARIVQHVQSMAPTAAAESTQAVVAADREPITA